MAGASRSTAPLDMCATRTGTRKRSYLAKKNGGNETVGDVLFLVSMLLSGVRILG